MQKKKYTLPEYPVKQDLWDALANTELPIIVYGMGNGADKLLLRLAKYGVAVSDFFASDGFVRGHSFHGKRVKSFSEIKTEYSDFIIVLSFATNREEVLDLLINIDKNHKLVIPDMPVCGDEYFDKEFYNDNYDKICKAYSLLADGQSRELFASVINYKLSGSLDDLLSITHTKDELYSLIGHARVAIDAGAYNGDTAQELLHYSPECQKIIAVEPDKKNYKRLLKTVESKSLSDKIIPLNLAAHDECAEGTFITSGNRNSSIGSTSSYESKLEQVPLRTLDSLTDGRVDYIKYDVEGAELSALRGSHRLISEFKPRLLVSAYHRSEDIFALPIYLAEKYPEYRLYLRRLRCVPAWEMNIIAVCSDT